MVLRAYINLKYHHDKIQIDYWMSIDHRNNFKTAGIFSSCKGLREAKNRLLSILEKSHEKEIKISRNIKIYSKLKAYSQIKLEDFKKLKEFLIKSRPDIKFK
ncbi:hypothetical protein KAI04_00285 [Candidatus Pacearchaeota archaeon]|nr:hypothetical protein [Candidatus Pacearchaeota archaeon]